MIPWLYEANATSYENNGVGRLSDAVSCTVTEERNGAFELTMQYPITGVHGKDISLRRVLLVEPSKGDDPQPFRIYKISKPLRGVVTVYAAHISYDLSGIISEPFTAPSAASAFAKLAQAVAGTPFSFWTDKTVEADLSVAVPSSIRAIMGGVEGSILDVYGGEFAYDGYAVKLYVHRGADNGVTIRYGKNMTDLTKDDNGDGIYTHVYPYWANADGELVQLPERVIATGLTDVPYGRTKLLDLSSDYNAAPTYAQLRASAEEYIQTHKLTEVSTHISVAFVPLDQTEEYANIAPLERVRLCDVVGVEYPELGVTAKSKVIKTVYNALTERYVSVELGEAKASLVDKVVAQESAIKNKPDVSTVRQMQELMGQTITGATGGCVRLVDNNNDGMPDELYIADNADPAQAVKVWRYNYEGWAVSKTGINGPYVMGATLEQGLLADFVTAAKLVAGTIQSADGSFFLDLDTGSVYLKSVQDALNDMDAALSAEVSFRKDDNGKIVEQLTQIRQAASALSILIQNIQDNGVDKVITSMGYSFTNGGMNIQKPGEEIKNKIDNTGVFVSRDANLVLEASASGVNAPDVTIRDRLNLCERGLFEKYNNGKEDRIGLFIV